MSCVCMVPDGNAVWVYIYIYRIEPDGTTSLIGKVSERFYSGKVKDWQIIAVKISITISAFTVHGLWLLGFCGAACPLWQSVKMPGCVPNWLVETIFVRDKMAHPEL